MKNLADNLANKICSINDITDSEKREIIAYGLEILLSTAVSVLIITILAILLGTFWETILFLLPFMLLRTYSGGYHAQTHFRCFLILLFAFCINLILNLFNINSMIIIFSAIASVIIILKFAPVEDKNHPLSKRQKKNNRKICMIVNTPTQIIEEPSIVSFSNDDENNTHIREDDDGIGWEVTTKDGYYESTAYLTLPTVVGKVSNTCPYMFYTFSSDNGFYIDVGICYEGGSAGLGWRGCYNVNGQLYAPNVIAGLSAGSKVYFHATIDENGFLRFRIINPNNFADVYYDISYYVYDKGIYRSNAIINRQITLCDSTKQYNCGTAIYNAKFENAYVYSSSNYALTTSVNCDESKCGKFGTNDVNINQVTETMDCKWYAENVSISF